LDLTTPDAAQRVEDFLDAKGLTVHTLVNNAGYGLVGDFRLLDRQEQLNMIQLNVMVLTDLTHRLLPAMIARGQGTVINVASSAAFQPSPSMGVYHATKSFVLFLTEALSEELRGTGVTATALCPGPVDQTEFGDRVGTDAKVPGLGIVRLSAVTVARKGLAGAARGKTIVVPGFWMRLNSVVAPRLPRWFVRKAIHWIQRQRRRSAD